MSTHTTVNWEGRVQAELMEVGGGRGHIPMILLFHVSRKRERNVPFECAKLFHITEARPPRQPREVIQMPGEALVWWQQAAELARARRRVSAPDSTGGTVRPQ